MEDRVSIRPARPDDAAGVLAIYAPIVRDTAISFEDEPPSCEEIAERIARSHVWLVAEAGGRIVGYCYAAQFHPRSAYRWSTEISVYLAEAARGRGLGAQLVETVLERLRELGFVNAFAGTALPNEGSLRLFESFGFEKIAHWDQVGFKLGAWHDVGWWQLRLQAPTTPPPPLRR
jgi:phosphinothricin acetyltransferase